MTTAKNGRAQERGQNRGIREVRERLLTVVDIAGILVISLFLIRMMQNNMFFGDLFPFNIYTYLIPAAKIVAAAKVILKLPDWKKLAIPVLFSLLGYISYRQTGYTFMIFMALLPVIGMDMDYRWVLRVYIAINGTFSMAAVLAGLCGATSVLVYTKSGIIRSSMGLVYPTDAASLMLFLVFAVGILWMKLSDWWLVILSLLGAGTVYYLNRSTTSTILFLVYACLIGGAGLFRSLPKLSELSERLKKAVQLLLAGTFWLLSAVTFVLVFLYQKKGGIGRMARLDTLFHERISFAAQAFQKHGISLFGTYFYQSGSEKSVITNPNYNFVDNSYALMLLRCGILIFLLVGILWSVKTWQLFRKGRYRAAIAMTAIAVHSFSEHHFIECNFNILMILLFTDLAVKEAARMRQNTDQIQELRAVKSIRAVRNVYTVVFAAVIAGIAYVAAPRVLSWVRTVCQISGRVNEAGNGGLVLLGFSFIVVLILLTILCLYHILWSVCMERTAGSQEVKTKGRAVTDNNQNVGSSEVPGKAGTLRKAETLRTAGTVLAICLLVFGGIALKAGQLIRRDRPAIEAIASEEAEQIRMITQAATGKVYVDQYPVIYGDLFDGISYSIFCGDELVRSSCATVIVDKDNESKAFLDWGYLYTQLNDHHSLYTNDQAVIDMLLANDYASTGFYSSEHTADLNQMASLNHLSVDENGILLKGKNQSLKYGPNTEALAGTYTVTWELTLPKKVEDGDTKICTVSAIGSTGEAAAERIVYASDFDEDGHASVSLTFETEDCIHIKFPVVVKGKKRKLYVEGISWINSVEREVRIERDENGRIAAHVFYDSRGHRIIGKDDYSAIRYAYSSEGRLSDEWYYDVNDQPVFRTQGYWHVHREYNAKGQLIYEAYFGLDDEPILRDNGYAAREMTYTENGNVLSEIYYDTEGRRISIPAGYAMITFEYDSEGNRTGERHFDLQDQPID